MIDEQDNPSDETDEVTGILEAVTTAHEKMYTLMRQLDLFKSRKRFGIYLETRASEYHEGGILLEEERGVFTAYSLTFDYFPDELINDDQFGQLKDLFEFMVDYLNEDVFIHSGNQSALSKVPKWMTVLWNESGTTNFYGTNFGYSFEKHKKFGNSPTASSWSVKTPNVHLWAEDLNEHFASYK